MIRRRRPSSYLASSWRSLKKTVEDATYIVMASGSIRLYAVVAFPCIRYLLVLYKKSADKIPSALAELLGV